MAGPSERTNTRLLINVLFLALSFLILLNMFLTNAIADSLRGQAPPPVLLTYLIDPSCDTCYNASLHGDILTSKFGIVIFRQRQVDYLSDEGRALIAQYNISALPTVIIDSTARFYPLFTESFLEVGTREEDGNFVFRAVERFGEDTFVRLP